jgi:quercetin dioxygenase-like cupin family protein
LGTVGQAKDWDHWERHPAGEEILTLLSGELELVLDLPDGERRAVLTAGQTFVVPRGIWHRAIVRQPGELLFITAGAGTEHRPVRL